MFKDLPEGQTHSYNDGCGNPSHNFPCHRDEPKAEWRENIHKTVAYFLYGNAKEAADLPAVIVDAIDAAYVAGLDDKKEDRERDPKAEQSSDCCVKCIKLFGVIGCKGKSSCECHQPKAEGLKEEFLKSDISNYGLIAVANWWLDKISAAKRQERQRLCGKFRMNYKAQKTFKDISNPYDNEALSEMIGEVTGYNQAVAENNKLAESEGG